MEKLTEETAKDETIDEIIVKEEYYEVLQGVEVIKPKNECESDNEDKRDES